MIDISESIANYFIEFCTIFRGKSSERTSKLAIHIENRVTEFEYLQIFNMIETFQNPNVRLELPKDAYLKSNKNVLDYYCNYSINEVNHPVMAQLLRLFHKKEQKIFEQFDSK
jgi:hypothetical protein